MKIKARLIPFAISTMMLSTLSYAALAPSQELSDKQAASLHIDRIKQFMDKQTLSTTFPYRIHLFTEGSIDKNKAGIRIGETAKQFATNDMGLLFYYQLYNHAMRVPHWHANAVELGTVINGKMRVTIWEGEGKTHVFTVEKNGTWMIPQAALHSLENVGPEKLTFFVSYNSPVVADRDFLTAWAALPDEILARSVGLTKEEISLVRKTTVNRLSSYDPSAVPEMADQPSPYANSFTNATPLYESPLGVIRRIDSSNPKMQNMGLQQTILKPGTLRIPHWYTDSNCVLFVSQGTGFFMMMDDAGKVFNVTVAAGDLISLPVGAFHSYLNIGNDDLVVYETFDAAKGLQEISLLSGAQQFSPGVIEGAIGLSKASAERITTEKASQYMMAF